MKNHWNIIGLASLTLAFTVGCGNDTGATGDDTGTGTGDETVGDGDGDPTGDGDGDPTTGDGDGDGDPTTGDGDGDDCPIGSEGCPCTDGGGCDPGLTCDAGVCGPDNTTGDGDGDPTTGDGDGDGDPTTGDGDGDPTTGDGDGDGDQPYQACPNGDADCAAGEICVSGGQMGNDWTMCTTGECNGGMDCDVTPDDVCADAPGDGEQLNYCLPLACDQQNPCPDPMVCYPGFGPNSQAVCLWPN